MLCFRAQLELEYIIGHHPADDNGRSHHGIGSDGLFIKNRHQNRVEHRLDAGDQAGRHRRGGLQANAQEHIGDPYLEGPQNDQAENRCGSKFRFMRQKGKPVAADSTSPQNTEEMASLSGISFIRNTPA